MQTHRFGTRHTQLPASRFGAKSQGRVFDLRASRRRFEVASHSRRDGTHRTDLLAMTIAAVHVDALQAFGYTEEEARFLYLVATHSGYFVARQFLAFAGVQWGKRTTLFWNKLRSPKHVRPASMPRHRAVDHLFARKLYRQHGRENLRKPQRHELEYIQARIANPHSRLANPE